MCNYYLGASFDIHGGGRDLLFPHHENEMAQSIAAMDGSFARYWVHNGFVTVESEKMSKSLGNFLTIRDALKIYHPEVLRLFLVSRHYRSPLDFSKNAVFDLQAGLVRIYRSLQRLEEIIGPYEEPGNVYLFGLSEDKQDSFTEEFIKAMDDDLNTAAAIGLIFDKVRDINKIMDSVDGALDKAAQSRLAESRRQVYSAGAVLGLLQGSPALFFQHLSSAEMRLEPEEVEKMIEERAEARINKDWAKSDQIRADLKDMGIVLEDGPKGTTWRLDV